jgi:hypothetical protein
MYRIRIALISIHPNSSKPVRSGRVALAECPAIANTLSLALLQQTFMFIQLFSLITD